MSLIDAHAATRLLDTFQDRIPVDGRKRPEVDDLAFDAIPGEIAGRVHGAMDHHAVGHDRAVAAVAHHVRFRKRDGIGFLRHVGLGGVEILVLAEDHRIVVADRLDEQSLGVVGIGGTDDLEPGNMGEERGQHL